MKQLAEKREHDKQVVQKAQEENDNFSKTMEEKLNQKMKANKENREARMAALDEKFKEKVRCFFHLFFLSGLSCLLILKNKDFQLFCTESQFAVQRVFNT